MTMTMQRLNETVERIQPSRISSSSVKPQLINEVNSSLQQLCCIVLSARYTSGFLVMRFMPHISKQETPIVYDATWIHFW